MSKKKKNLPSLLNCHCACSLPPSFIPPWLQPLLQTHPSWFVIATRRKKALNQADSLKKKLLDFVLHKVPFFQIFQIQAKTINLFQIFQIQAKTINLCKQMKTLTFFRKRTANWFLGSHFFSDYARHHKPGFPDFKRTKSDAPCNSRGTKAKCKAKSPTTLAGTAHHCQTIQEHCTPTTPQAYSWNFQTAQMFAQLCPTVSPKVVCGKIQCYKEPKNGCSRFVLAP